MTPVPARTHDLARTIVAETGRSASGLLQHLIPAGRALTPQGFAITPSLLREPNADRAGEIYQGQFSLAGTKVEPGARSPFLAIEAPLRWRRSLASFSWLHDLASSESELARIQARCLITDWTTTDARRRGPGWETEVIAQRLIAWLSTAPFYLANASGNFHTRLLASAGRQIRHLNTLVANGANAWPRLHGAVALNYAVVCTDGLDKHVARMGDTLDQVIARQLLPDGGHLSRNPARVVDLLELLLPLKVCFADRGIDPPGNLINALDRLFPLLRMFLHGDKGLAFFNGASETRRKLISTILALDTQRAKPMSSARQSGYSRLEQGKTVIIADTGSPGSVRASDTGHSGALSFEMSHGTQRIIINCGYCGDGPDEWRAATRSTAAHSTLSVSDRSSATVVNGRLTEKLFGGPLTFGPQTVTAEIQPSDAGALLSASHDGYMKAFHLTHHREIYLAASGSDVRGEDRLTEATQPSAGARPSSHPFSIRFHLHPSVKATLSKDNTSILLLLPDKSGWRFSARGALMKIEESVYFVDRDVPHRTHQIVLFAETSRTPMVQWALKQIEKSTEPPRRKQTKISRLPLKGGRMN